MKIVSTQSIEADTAYVAFGDERDVAKTIAPIEDLAIDLDAEGRVVGIEFVTASRLLHPSALADAEEDELIGVTEIADFLGKRKQNVAQHYTRRSDFPKPVAELPTGRYWRRRDIEAWWSQSEIGRQRRAETRELAAAAEWLTTSLASGSRRRDELREDGRTQGFSWAVLKRAAGAIEVEERRNGDLISWALPADHPALGRRD